LYFPHLLETVKMKLFLSAAFLLFLFLTPIQANAQTLTGETITSYYLFPTTGTVLAGPQATIVPGGIIDFAGFADVTFSAQNILITAERDAGVNAVAFDGFEFSDPDDIFNSVTLDPSSTYAGLTSSRISFNSGQIFVNVADLAGLDGQTISLDINTPLSPTPELGTGLLMLSGALVFAIKKLLSR
jgi:hypothetical protein